VRENGRQFVQHKFEAERIDNTSILTWYPISDKTRVDVVRKITRSDMQLFDDIVNFGEILGESSTGYMAKR
jgi:hypothetical protein